MSLAGDTKRTKKEQKQKYGISQTRLVYSTVLKIGQIYQTGLTHIYSLFQTHSSLIKNEIDKAWTVFYFVYILRTEAISIFSRLASKAGLYFSWITDCFALCLGVKIFKVDQLRSNRIFSLPKQNKICLSSSILCVTSYLLLDGWTGLHETLGV